VFLICIFFSTSTANYSLTPHFFEVTAGTNARQRHGDVHSQSRQVDEVILHPKMIQFKTGLTEWDLALLHLKLPLLYTDYVQPICFPDENDVFPTNSQCYLAGWGFINTQEGTFYADYQIPNVYYTIL
jgi:serine protease 7 (enterokinase)